MHHIIFIYYVCYYLIYYDKSLHSVRSSFFGILIMISTFEIVADVSEIVYDMVYAPGNSNRNLLLLALRIYCQFRCIIAFDCFNCILDFSYAGFVGRCAKPFVMLTAGISGFIRGVQYFHLVVCLYVAMSCFRCKMSSPYLTLSALPGAIFFHPN